MSYTRKVTFDNQKELAAGSIGVNYAAVGTEFFHPTRLLIVQNLTDALLQFSTNEREDKFPLPANGQIVLDFSANEAGNVPWFLPAKTQIFVKRIGTPTTGTVYITAVHGTTD